MKYIEPHYPHSLYHVMLFKWPNHAESLLCYTIGTNTIDCLKWKSVLQLSFYIFHDVRLIFLRVIMMISRPCQTSAFLIWVTQIRWLINHECHIIYYPLVPYYLLSTSVILVIIHECHIIHYPRVSYYKLSTIVILLIIHEYQITLNCPSNWSMSGLQYTWPKGAELSELHYVC